MNPTEWADILDKAKSEKRAISAFSAKGGSETLDFGYHVQEVGLERALGRGAKLSGYKMGLTSKAKQRDVGVNQPIHGYLLKETEVTKGGELKTADRIHPRVEPEIAVVLRRMPRGLWDVRDSLEGVYPALEIIDSRFEKYQFSLTDVVADNASSSGFMVGSTNLLHTDFSLMGVVLRKNGKIEQTGAPAAALGDPLLSVMGLVEFFNEKVRVLEPGTVILTGGLTASVPFQAGDLIEVEWGIETLSFRAV